MQIEITEYEANLIQLGLLAKEQYYRKKEQIALHTNNSFLADFYGTTAKKHKELNDKITYALAMYITQTENKDK